MYLSKRTPTLPSELADTILRLPGMESSTMTINQEWNAYFNSKMLPFKASPAIFQHFLVDYCNTKLKTNPRWAYYAYKKNGDNNNNDYPTILKNYQIQTLKNIPWKKIIRTIVINSAINFCFQTFRFEPISITAAYFLILHFITLFLLYKYNIFTNVDNLFSCTSSILIVLNFFINLACIL